MHRLAEQPPAAACRCTRAHRQRSRSLPVSLRRPVRHGVNKLLILPLEPNPRNDLRLSMRLACERSRSDVRDPNLDRTQAPTPQPLPMSANLLTRIQRPACPHSRSSGWLHVTYHGSVATARRVTRLRDSSVFTGRPARPRGGISIRHRRARENPAGNGRRGSLRAGAPRARSVVPPSTD